MILRIPPIVSQNLAKLPDGNVDPAAANDCGESDLCSVLDAIRGLYISPGCIRQSVASSSGLTTGDNLAWFLGRVNLKGQVIEPVYDEFGLLRHHGRYLIALGAWIDPRFEHWMVAYQGDPGGVHFMDPWTGSYTYRDAAQFANQYAGQAVAVAP